MRKALISAAIAGAMLTSSGVTAATQGITGDTIRVGSHTDLSGPLAIWGVPATNGMKMRIEETNSAGGVHGRKIEVLVEDSAYQVPQAVRATRKMVQKNKIFAMLTALGTPQNLAAMKILDRSGVPNLFPITAAASMVEPHHPLHFGYFVSYQHQAAGALKHFHKTEGVDKICLQTVATDYGKEVENGARKAADALGIEIVLHGTHKTTETEFAGVATSIKNTDCDMLLLGTTVKDTITLYATLRKLGWEKPIVGNMVPYMPLVAEAGDGATEGLYLVAPFVIANFEDGDEWRADFHKRYTSKYGEEPAAQSQIGYVAADLFIKALEAAGPDVSPEKLGKALESIKDYEDPFGGPTISFSETKHAGGDSLVLVQVKDKSWRKIVTDLPY